MVLVLQTINIAKKVELQMMRMSDIVKWLVERCKVVARTLIPDIHLDCWDRANPATCKEAITLWGCVTLDLAPGVGDEVAELLDIMLIASLIAKDIAVHCHELESRIAASKYLKENEELLKMVNDYTRTATTTVATKPLFVINGMEYMSLTERVREGKLWWHRENQRNS